MSAPRMVQAWSGRWFVLPDLPPTKEEAPCCLARRDRLGRLPVGFCSPGCVRRPT